MPDNVIVKRYKSDKAYQQDAEQMARQGFAVQSATSEQPRTGCMRFIMLGGIGALFFKPKPQLVVTYVRR